MNIIDCEQGTAEWFSCRRGVPTASVFKRIITAKHGKYSESAAPLISELIDDLIRPGVQNRFLGDEDTARGHRLEPEARQFYQFERDCVVRQVGFVLSDCGRFGCSPDALTDEGGAEIKAPDGPKHVQWLLSGGLPDEHKAQVHGSLIITGCPWWDFVSYCPGYDPIIVRVVPDEFTEKLRVHLERFHKEYTAALSRFGIKHPSEE